MREGWVETTLGEVAEVVSGGTPSTSTPEFWDGDVTWITPTEVTANEGKVIFDSTRRLTTAGLNSSSAKLIPAGSVLLTSRATIGAVALAGTELSTNQGFASLVAGERAISRFLMYWCQQNKAEFESRAAGNTFKEISRRKVAEVPLTLPPLAEQRRIVDVIESVDTYIAALEKRAETARTARSALLHNLLSNPGPNWRSVRLEDIAFRIGMGPFGSNIKVETFVEVGIPIISGSHLGELTLTDSDFRFITEEHAARLAGSAVYRGDVVLTHAGTVGQVSLIPEDSEYQQYVLSQRQFFVRPNPTQILGKFLAIFLRYGDGQLQLLSNVNRTGVPSLSQPVKFTRQMRIDIPSLEDQQKIVSIFEAFDSFAKEADQSVSSSKRLRSALLSDLLSGDHEIPASYDELLGAA